MSELAERTRAQIGVELWRAVDFDPSRVGDVNVLADAVLVLLDKAHAAGMEQVARPVRALCEDSEAYAEDPMAGLVAAVDLRRVIDQDGP